jgi:hypothetical protein
MEPNNAFRDRIVLLFGVVAFCFSFTTKYMTYDAYFRDGNYKHTRTHTHIFTKKETIHKFVHLYYNSLKWPLACAILFCPVLSSMSIAPMCLCAFVYNIDDELVAKELYNKVRALCKIGTKTHWDYAMKIGGRRARVRR